MTPQPPLVLTSPLPPDASGVVLFSRGLYAFPVYGRDGSPVGNLYVDNTGAVIVTTSDASEISEIGFANAPGEEIAARVSALLAAGRTLGSITPADFSVAVTTSNGGGASFCEIQCDPVSDAARGCVRSACGGGVWGNGRPLDDEPSGGLPGTNPPRDLGEIVYDIGGPHLNTRQPSSGLGWLILAGLVFAVARSNGGRRNV